MRWLRYARIKASRRREESLRDSIKSRVQLMEFNGDVYIALDGLPIRKTVSYENVCEILERTRNDLFEFLNKN